jgi:small subunit ribosomal protein S6
MKNRYEALFILRTQGKDEGAKDIIDRIAADFKSEGAEVEQIQKMDRRQFSYVAGDLDSGYYVNFVFSGPPTIIEKLKTKFRLDTDVYRQHYQKLESKKVANKA